MKSWDPKGPLYTGDLNSGKMENITFAILLIDDQKMEWPIMVQKLGMAYECQPPAISTVF